MLGNCSTVSHTPINKKNLLYYFIKYKHLLFERNEHPMIACFSVRLYNPFKVTLLTVIKTTQSDKGSFHAIVSENFVYLCVLSVVLDNEREAVERIGFILHLFYYFLCILQTS